MRPALYLLFLVGGSTHAQQLVLPGDHPDPTVIRIGGDYWASNTSAEWLPVFPLFHSTDLTHWDAAGAVFQSAPAWASGNFWAPELVNETGKIRVYYAARKRGGPLCVAVAEAAQPQGPYQDHGPLVCQPDGSIDPFFVKDENGAPYLVWKEDGNSQQKPSWIWAQPLTSDGLAVTGTPTHLIRNDAPWEGAVVEGADILRHGGWFYLFYAGGACCGLKCDYAVGVARSRSLLGPWDKDPGNPIETGDATWSCPGHGTIVETPAGTYEFLHHAYPRGGSVFIGREAVIDEVRWGPDGWPFVARDESWQWPLSGSPKWHRDGQVIELAPAPGQASDPLSAVLAKSLTTLSFTASVSVEEAGGMAGLVVIGDRENAIGIAVANGEVFQYRRVKGEFDVLAKAPLAHAQLRISGTGTTSFVTEFRAKDGEWTKLGNSLEGRFLPPWDRGLRIGVFCDAPAKFDNFSSTP